jgi:hypothetical protein
MDNDRNIYTLGISYAYIPSQTSEEKSAINWVEGISYAYIPSQTGFTKRIKSPIIIDLVIENQQFRSRRVEKYQPTEKNPNYTYGGYAWNTGLSITLKL